MTILRTHYHGWTDSLIMRHEVAEVVVVPAIGRIMQLRFLGDEEGPFWDNRGLDGQTADPASKDWANFGGDKAWPAPEADWSRVTPRSWPPPIAFDASPVQPEVEINDHRIILVSPVDPHYGITVRRVIELIPQQPSMRVSTTFEKVTGQPVTVSVWVVTQLKHPEMIFVPVPQPSLFPDGCYPLVKTPPPDLRREGPYLTLARNKTEPHKIGSDGDSLLCIGSDWVMQIESPRVPNQAYPDHGSSVEVYTNPDPLPYIELETLGPLQTLEVGDSINRVNLYHLRRRSEASPLAEANRVYGF